MPGENWLNKGGHVFEAIQWFGRIQLEISPFMPQTKFQLSWTFGYWEMAISTEHHPFLIVMPQTLHIPQDPLLYIPFKFCVIP